MPEQTPQPLTSFSSRVFEGVFWVSAGSLAVRVVGFVVSIFLLKTFSLHEYGTYQLVLAAGGLLSLLLLQGIDDVAVAEGARALVAQERERYRNVLRGYWFFKMATGALVWLFLFFGSSVLSRWYSADILSLLRWYAAVFLIIPFERAILMNFAVRRAFGRTSAYAFIQEVLKGILVFVCVGWLHLGIAGVLIAMVLSMFCTAILFCVPACVEMCSGQRFSWSPFFSLLRTQGPWVIGQRLVRQAEKNLRPFFIQLFLGREVVALFSIAEKIYGYVAASFPIDDVLIPMIAGESHDRERVQRIVHRGIKYSVPVYTLIAILAAACAPWLLKTFFHQYVAAIPLVYSVLAYVPFIGCAFILTSFFVSHQEQKKAFFLSLVRMMLFVCILPLSMILFGAIGVGMEFFLTMTSYNILRFVVLQKEYPEMHLRWSQIFSIDHYDRAVWGRLKKKIYFFSKT